MRKALSLTLALTLALCVGITAFAADASTIVTYETPTPPSYTVTIPATIALSEEKGPDSGTNFDAVLSNVPANQRVSVTVADAKYPENEMGVSGSVYETLAVCSYDLTTLKYKVELADGTIINPKHNAQAPAVRGREFCSFTGNGAESEQSQTLQFLIYDKNDLTKPEYKGKSFSSQLTFDIALVDA